MSLAVTQTIHIYLYTHTYIYICIHIYTYSKMRVLSKIKRFCPLIKICTHIHVHTYWNAQALEIPINDFFLIYTIIQYAYIYIDTYTWNVASVVDIKYCGSPIQYAFRHTYIRICNMHTHIYIQMFWCTHTTFIHSYIYMHLQYTFAIYIHVCAYRNIGSIIQYTYAYVLTYICNMPTRICIQMCWFSHTMYTHIFTYIHTFAICAHIHTYRYFGSLIQYIHTHIYIYAYAMYRHRCAYRKFGSLIQYTYTYVHTCTCNIHTHIYVQTLWFTHTVCTYTYMHTYICNIHTHVYIHKFLFTRTM